MKKGFLMIGILVSTILITGCGHEEKHHPTHVVKKTPEVNITTTVNPADGLDLKLVGALFQNGQIKNAEGLEKELNKPDGINNLDLDGDGQVDYINVSENQAEGVANVKSFDLTTGAGENVTYIATIEMEKGANDTYEINMAGSEQVYGTGHNYHVTHHPSVGEMMFYAWLFSPRPYYYHAPYHVGFYPAYYGGPRTVVSRSSYTQRTTTQRTVANKTTTKSATSNSKVKSSNKGKIAPKARTSINNNTKAQKSFQKRNTNKAVTKGGFTKSANTPNKNSKTTAKRNTPRSSASSPSRRNNGFSSSRSTRRSSGFGSSSSRRSSGFGSSSRRSGGFGGGSRRRSDVNYKNDIQPVNDALNSVMQMQGVTYYWDSIPNYKEVVGGDYDKSRQVGFIAQDIEKIVPEVVNEDEYGKVVSYDLLVPILVEAIKEQQKEIHDLQLKIEKLDK